MIDWYIIEHIYPNAFMEFTKMMFPNVGLPSISVLCYYDIKKLYRFFDKNGIYLTVEMLTKNNWVFTISLIEGKTLVPQQDSKPNRELIEVDGFYECFRYLEKKHYQKNTHK
jgi:hypothetical protein